MNKLDKTIIEHYSGKTPSTEVEKTINAKLVEAGLTAPFTVVEAMPRATDSALAFIQERADTYERMLQRIGLQAQAGQGLDFEALTELEAKIQVQMSNLVQTGLNNTEVAVKLESLGNRIVDLRGMYSGEESAVEAI